ncbi:MAG: class I SAM-dependent methyltransferase [Alphaproteobacteria bacterium]|nr:class I SAM-dependent methyltransferase [Alphaproteobacteria bacterium]
MKECGKACKRRAHDPSFVTRFLAGTGLDVGSGADPLSLYIELFPRIAGLKAFTPAEGDCAKLEPIKDASYDFVHSCFLLQLLPDPKEAFGHWLRCVKPGGHLVVTVPDEDLYEQGVFPSAFNREHRWSFTLAKSKSFHDKSLNLLDLVRGLGAEAEPVRLNLIDDGYRYRLPRFDQTLTPTGEAAIELVIRRRPRDEIEFGGRPPRPSGLTKGDFALLTGFKLG